MDVVVKEVGKKLRRAYNILEAFGILYGDGRYLKEMTEEVFINVLHIDYFYNGNYPGNYEEEFEKWNKRVEEFVTLTPHHFRECIKPQPFIEFSHFLRGLRN